MATAAQITANIANAQHSTGPRTEEGKAASAQNSLKHGLTAQTVLLPGEDEAAYRAMCQGMFQSLGPEAEPEEQLVQLLCDTQWRLHRCARLEAGILDAAIPDFKQLDVVSKHEARLKKQYSVTLKEATEMIEARRSREDEDLKEAVILRRADKIDGCVTDLQALGFVFSNERVDGVIMSEDALALARKVLLNDRVSKMGSYDVKNQAQ